MLTYIPLIILSGAFGALQSLPHWLNTAVTYLPAQPVIDAASRALTGSGGALMPGHDVAVLAGWVVGGLLISFRFFPWIRTARRTHGRRRHAVRSVRHKNKETEEATVLRVRSA